MNRALLIYAGLALGGFLFGALSAPSHREIRSPLLTNTATPARSPQEIIAPTAETALSAVLQARTRNTKLDDLVACGEELERLDAVQMAKLLDGLRRRPAKLEDDALAQVFTWWLKRDAKSASAWIHTLLDVSAQQGPRGLAFISNNDSSLIWAWARSDAAAALNFALEHAGTAVADLFLERAMSDWPEKETARRFEFLRAFPADAAQSTALIDLLIDWTKEDPARALAAAGELADAKNREMAIAAVLRAWPANAAAQGLEQCQALGITDGAAYSNLVCQLAAADPARALEMLDQLDPARYPQNARHLATVWAEKDPISALNWTLENGVDMGGFYYPPKSIIKHDDLGRSYDFPDDDDEDLNAIGPLAQALQSAPDATLAWLQALPAGYDRDRLTELAAGNVGLEWKQRLALFSSLPPAAQARLAGGMADNFFHDPDAGEQWAATLPEGNARENAWQALGSHIGGRPDLPLGKDRDAFLAGAVQDDEQMTMKDLATPATILDLALEISDPTLRQSALEGAMETYGQKWGKEVGDWLDGSSLPAALKARLRTQLAQAQAQPTLP